MKAIKINSPSCTLLMLAVALILIACEKEEVDPGRAYPYNNNGFYFVNEGNFTWGNGSLSFFSYDSLEVYNNTFTGLTNKDLGDIPIRVKTYLDKLYIIVNNSGRIEIIDKDNATHTGTFDGLVSPRDIAFLGNEMALVSSLYSDSLTLVNLNTYSVESYINIGCSSECILVEANKIFVSNWSDGNKIIVLDGSSLDIVEIITVTREPADMVIDKAGILRVLCSGGYMNDEFPAIIGIDTENFEIVSNIQFPIKNINPTELVINSSLDTLYFLNSDIFRMAYNASSIPENPFIESDLRNLYRLGFDRENGSLFVSDAVDYVQKGYIYLYSAEGEEIFKGKADIIPGKMSN